LIRFMFKPGKLFLASFNSLFAYPRGVCDFPLALDDITFCAITDAADQRLSLPKPNLFAVFLGFLFLAETFFYFLSLLLWLIAIYEKCTLQLSVRRTWMLELLKMRQQKPFNLICEKNCI